MKPDEFVCFPRFHRDEIESRRKRAARYQRKLIREFRAYITELGGIVEGVLTTGSLRIFNWAITNPHCEYRGTYASQYSPLAKGRYRFKSEVIVEEVVVL
jgi:hypothetical protein